MATDTPVDIGTLITCTPGVVGGRPYIKGTQLPVKAISVLYIEGMAPGEIAADYAHVDLAGIYAALVHYHANRASLDADLEEDRRKYKELTARNLSLADPRNRYPPPT